MSSKVAIIVMLLFSISETGTAQNNKFLLGLRVPVQLEFQQEDIAFPIVFLQEKQTATVLNYGIDFLAEQGFSKAIGAYTGIGYFRNKFNFKKFYNHRRLNIGTDSIPIGTSTHNYIYNLLRFPLGISYTITSTQRGICKIGGEIIFNYSFQKIYNGGKPFPDANNELSKFQYSGNTINLFACIGIPTSFSFLELGPYVRIYHTYKRDEILYEDPKEKITNNFDALGISIKYHLKISKK